MSRSFVTTSTIMTIKSGLQSRRSILKGHLKNAIRRRKVGHREMKIGKPVDLHLTSECECVICMETLSAKNIAVTPCGHKFCFTCLMENFKSSNKCPLCREVVAPEIPRPRLDDEEIGECVYLNGQEIVHEVVKAAKRWDKYEALCEISNAERQTNKFIDTTELFEAFGPQPLINEEEDRMSMVDDVLQRISVAEANQEWHQVRFVEQFEESDSEEDDSEESDSEEDDSESSESFICYHELANELIERAGGKLSSREKQLVTICLEHLGRSSTSIRDWYDRNKTM